MLFRDLFTLLGSNAPATGVSVTRSDYEVDLVAVVEVLASSGTPTFSLALEQSNDKTNWYPLHADITETGLYEVVPQLKHMRARLASVSGGGVLVRAIAAPPKSLAS